MPYKVAVGRSGKTKNPTANIKIKHHCLPTDYSMDIHDIVEVLITLNEKLQLLTVKSVSVRTSS